MKTLLLLTLIVSTAAFAKTEKLKFMQDRKDDVIILKNDKTKVILPTQFKIKEDIISAYIGNQEVTIATIDKATSTADLVVSNENLEVNIIKNKTEKRFESKLCSHMGCILYPHFETLTVQLLEITTSEGEVICWNLNGDENRLERSSLSFGHCQ